MMRRLSGAIGRFGGVIGTIGILTGIGAGAAGAIEVALETVATGLERPVTLAHAGDGSGRLFVAEQAGRIRIVRDGELLAQPFLDLRPLVGCCGERGLLGLAFHPDYPMNRLFFVHYTDRQGNTVVARYRAAAGDADRADPGSEEVLLTQVQPFANHNGGQLAFGPDGYLYIALGDGGGAGDPLDRAQDLGTLLGKILRLDVDGRDEGKGYAIPAGNPFRGVPGARGEIWAFGLRNPWRFSFDRALGDLFIGDVGQSSWEEVDLQRAASAGGENYGWPRMEGRHCFRPPTGCEAPGLTLPILEYGRSGGCTVIGGYRYRGLAIPELYGAYIFGDFCAGTIWQGVEESPGGATWSSTPLIETGTAIASFGEDEAGELYVLEYREEGARLFQLVAPEAAACTGASRLCLGRRDRFEVTAAFRTRDGRTASAVAHRLTRDSGYFVFFNEANVEVVIKVLDACGIAERYWVFLTGLTDVEVRLRVHDREADEEVRYENPLRRPFPPFLDTDALKTCP